jgi:GTP cyclohydrolase IB
MNIHTPEFRPQAFARGGRGRPCRLRQWAGKSSDDEIARLDSSVGFLVPGQGYPVLSRDYPAAFRADKAYLATLPDLQNGPASLIRGEVAIQHVGISNFRLPIRYPSATAGR